MRWWQRLDSGKVRCVVHNFKHQPSFFAMYPYEMSILGEIQASAFITAPAMESSG
ncbi:MAG TPA: hypothetical protein PLV50_15130 [Smithella sp.]|nr:hypothetical protein [Smithella sp.]